MLQTTTLITVDTNAVRVTGALPAANDLRNDLYGLGVKITRYDYFFNPRKGFSVECTAAAGIKNIGRNPTVENIRFLNPDATNRSIYDTMQLRSVQYRFYFRGDVFMPVSQRLVGRIELNGGHVETQNLFISELFRIGGLRTLKGFDEQSIFVSTYGIINAELRYLLQQNSNVMLFWNGAWYKNAVREVLISDTPYGLGAGLNFETGAGVFSLYYAVGRQFNNPVEFNKAKIHFGFVNYF
jgi:hemolysin activation/secretion protein